MSEKIIRLTPEAAEKLAKKAAKYIDQDEIAAKVKALIPTPKNGKDGQNLALSESLRADVVDAAARLVPPGKPGLPGEPGKDGKNYELTRADIDEIVQKVRTDIEEPPIIDIASYASDIIIEKGLFVTPAALKRALTAIVKQIPTKKGMTAGISGGEMIQAISLILGTGWQTGGGTAVWGGITGVLSAQTDLDAALLWESTGAALQSKVSTFDIDAQTGDLKGATAILTDLTASQIVETDAGKSLISAAKGTAYNKAFGNSAGTVAEGDKPAMLAGRAGGQILIGGTGASENLTLKSTSHATKGIIHIDDGGRLAIGAATGLIGRLDVDGALHVQPEVNAFGTSNIYSAFVIGSLTGANAQNGGLYAIGRFVKTNEPFVCLCGWDWGSGVGVDQGRTMYYGGGGWNAPDATIHQFYTAAAYNETNNGGVLRLVINADGTVDIKGLTTANGILRNSATGKISSSVTLPNGTLGTTQAAGDNSTKVATTAYVDTTSQLITTNTKTATGYTLTVADSFTITEFANGATGYSCTFPQDSAAAIPIGAWGIVTKTGAGAITLTKGTGVTFRSAYGDQNVGLVGADGYEATWHKTAANTFMIGGTVIG